MTTGTLQQVEQRTSEKGNEYLRVQIDGQWYTSFQEPPELPPEATTVEFTEREDQDGVIDIQGEAEETGNENTMSRDDRILRQWAVKVAAQMGPEPHGFETPEGNPRIPGNEERVADLFDRAELVRQEAEERWDL